MASKKTESPNGKGANGPATSVALVSLANNLSLPQEFIEELQQSQSLAEVAPEDRLIAHECFNVKLKDKDDQWIPANRFFNTVTEEPTAEIDAVLLFLKKSRRYVVWDDDAGSTLTCHSLDLQVGNWQEPAEIKQCLSCPYQRWNGNGRNHEPPKCKLVWNFVGINLKTGDPFIISAKSTSLRPMKQFLNRHFIGKLRGKNLPLFCYAVKLKLTQPIGTYAVLEPEVGPAFSGVEIQTWHRLGHELWNSQRVDLVQMSPEDIESQTGEEEEEKEPLPF